MATAMSWLHRRRFLALLLALVLLLVVYPLLRGVAGTRLLFDALLTLVFLAAVPAVFTQKQLRLLAVALAVPTVVGAWTGYLLPGLPRPPLVVAFHLVAALFFALTVGTILLDIFRAESVSADGIYGALCGYLLVGLVFGHLYCLLECVAPGSFRGTEGFVVQLEDEEQCHFLLTYFSLVTLTTVGYGAIVPASDAARGLAVVEAVMGQFYIGVLVAELIGLKVSQAVAARSPGPGASGSPGERPCQDLPTVRRS
jgi:voltage-gated potassium channel